LNKNRLSDIDCYFITDSRLTKKGTLSDVRNALKAGCRIIQYREKDKGTREMVREAQQLKYLCQERALFLVNDRIDVALAADADGVHLGQDDMPFDIARHLLGLNKIVGLTVHNVGEAKEAERFGADYVGLSPIFPTDTKPDAGAACGIKTIREVRKAISIPIVAVGGINIENVEEVISAGADAAAALSALICQDDVYEATRHFISAIRSYKNQ